jgi:transcription elongation factor GreA
MRLPFLAAEDCMELPVVTRLKKELQELKHELTVKVPKELQEAAAHGDLSENAEYEAAKARQEFLKARIGQMQSRIRELAMYTLASIPHDVVAYGSRVTVREEEEGTTSEYRIVFPEEVDAASGAISLSSPIGRALLNKTVGDEVEVQAPGGKHSYQIIGLVTLHQSAAEASGGR